MIEINRKLKRIEMLRRSVLAWDFGKLNVLLLKYQLNII